METEGVDYYGTCAPTYQEHFAHATTEALQISKDASKDEIRKAYRKVEVHHQAQNIKF